MVINNRREIVIYVSYNSTRWYVNKYINKRVVSPLALFTPNKNKKWVLWARTIGFLFGLSFHIKSFSYGSRLVTIKDQFENDLIGSKVEEVAGAGEMYYIGKYKGVILYKFVHVGNNEALENLSGVVGNRTQVSGLLAQYAIYYVITSPSVNAHLSIYLLVMSNPSRGLTDTRSSQLPQSNIYARLSMYLLVMSNPSWGRIDKFVLNSRRHQMSLAIYFNIGLWSSMWISWHSEILSQYFALHCKYHNLYWYWDIVSELQISCYQKFNIKSLDIWTVIININFWKKKLFCS